MRRNTNIFVAVAGIACGLAVFLSGCQSGQTQVEPVGTPASVDANEPTPAAESLPSEQSHPQAPSATDVDWVLRFVPDQSVTYAVTTETERAVKWEGDTSNKPDAFRGGAIGSRAEVKFEQRVNHVEDDGDAVLDITILAVKFFGSSRGTVVLDFDSSRDADQASPMAKLIGQRYQVTMTPKGKVLSIGGTDEVRGLIQGTSADDQMARKLISDKEIRERHDVPALTASKDDVVHPGQTWSDVRVISFGQMGARAYERLYTFDRVETDDGDRVAQVTMEGIPSAAAAKQLYESQQDVFPQGMMDNIGSYKGQFQFDLTTGQVDTSAERFHMEWVVVDPSAIQAGSTNPPAMRMTLTQSYKLERVK